VSTNATNNTVDPNAPYDPAFAAAATSKGSWLVNGRLALTGMDVGGTKLQVALWSRNLLNNRGLVQAVPFGPVTSTIYERARTFGVDVGVEF
jgi:iron complex outermembrane receptor protein